MMSVHATAKSQVRRAEIRSSCIQGLQKVTQTMPAAPASLSASSQTGPSHSEPPPALGLYAPFSQHPQ